MVRVILALLVLTIAGSPGGAAEADLDVVVADGRLSVEVEAVPLADLLAVIAEQTGAALEIRGDLGTSRPQAFRDVALAEGLRQLVAPNGLMLSFAPAEGTAPARLSTIRVLGAGGLDAPGAAEERFRVSGAASRTAVLRNSFRSYREIAALDPKTRARALTGVATNRGAEATSILAEALASDPEPAVRRTAAAELARLKNADALAALEAAHGDADPGVRVTALKGYAAVGDDATGLLAEVLASDDAAAVRRTAAQLLARIETAEAEAALEAALDDADATVRSVARRTLGR